ncbi:MAG: hypothetical protein Q7K65_00635 [Candidatus Buchananbacteria bacterium]|nr:hypothetical protein [Candidatus Buchananbacteria bacterium]
MKRPNIKKINFFLIVRYLYPATIIVIVITLIILTRFLYNNVYQTIIQAELITDLRKEISDQSLERDKFNQIISNVESKIQTEQINTEQIKDPFQNLTLPPPEQPKP